MLRFGDRLPFASFLSLGEGDTPVARLHRLTEELSLDAVDIKLEGSNPTGSHKDRMTSQFVARAVAKRAPVVAAASSGNAGASLAAYAAAAGLRCAIVTTPKMSSAWRRAIELTGAELHFVEDPLDRWRFIREKSESDGWFSATNVCLPPTSSEPFGVDGYKTLAYELAQDPQTARADTILVPTARGDLLWGIYAGLKELVDENVLAICRAWWLSSLFRAWSSCWPGRIIGAVSPAGRRWFRSTGPRSPIRPSPPSSDRTGPQSLSSRKTCLPISIIWRRRDIISNSQPLPR